MLSKRSLFIIFIFIAMLASPAAAGEQLEQTQANLEEIKNGLNQRQAALAEEWAALKTEKAELDRIASGGTLSGSKKNKYIQRTAAFNERMMKHAEEKEKLRQDIETYNAAVNQMAAAVDAREKSDTEPGPEPEADPPAPASAQSQQEIDDTAARLNRTREELAAEYKALQQEKQRIASSGEGGTVISEQTQEINKKINEFAKRRERFNKGVTDFNELTGQNVQILPAP
ncbi:hypothetical protein ACFL7E_04420 [Thermodesulfobacteriota bacterium]